MTELLGIDNITATLNNWLIKNNFTARVRGLDEDFFWYHDDTIGYALAASEENIKSWQEFLHKLNCQYEIDVFYSIFLHELGHSETYYTFTDEEIDECEQTHDLLVEDPASFALPAHEVYYNLPIELAATQWAINFINHNYDKVKDLVESVGAAIKVFYSINNIKED